MKYKIRDENDKKAIFDETGKQLSEWWKYIWPNGLVKGESDFYRVENDKDKEAIFHKSGVQVSEWWNYIYPDGLVEGESDFYIVLNDDHKEAIFHKSGIQISEWWNEILLFNGLVNGTSSEYRVCSEEDYVYKTLTFDRTKFIYKLIKEKKDENTNLSM
jgi:hypothetical protein